MKQQGAILMAASQAGSQPGREVSGSRSPKQSSDATQQAQHWVVGSDVLRQIGQTLMISLHGENMFEHARIMVEKYHVGNIFISRRDITDAKNLAKNIYDLQVIAHNSGHRSPLIIATDQENGMVFCDTHLLISRPTGDNLSTQFPGAMALGATRSPGLAYEVAKAAGQELYAIGVNWNLAPVFDIIDESNFSVVGVQSFGDEPGDVGRLGVAFMDGMRSAGIGTFVKNFPGYDTSQRSSQVGASLYTDKSREELEASDMIPFRRALAVGLDGIVLNPMIWQGKESQITPDSQHLIHHIVRRQLGFEGPVLCDCNVVPSLLERIPMAEVPIIAAMAGCDILLLRDDPGLQVLCIEALYSALQNRKLFEVEVTRSCSRVLSAKDRHLSWKKTLENKDVIQTLPDLVSQHQGLARDAYQRAITLVRDEQFLLPINRTLKMNESILLLTPVVQPIRGSILGHGTILDPFECFGRAIAVKHPRVRHAPYTRLGLNDTHLALLQSSSMVILVSFNAQSKDADVQRILARTLIRLCDGKAIVTLAVGDPFDLLHDKPFGTYLCSYEYTKAALETTAAILFGDLIPTGTLPLRLATKRLQRKWEVQPWDKTRDLYSSADLWKDCLGKEWPLNESTLSTLLDRPGSSQHFVVKKPDTNELLGLCATYTIRSGNSLIGSLAVLLVRQSHRNVGIGLSLHETAVKSLGNIQGISSMHLGSIFPRFFPGLPTTMSENDQSWFMHRGWKMEDNFIYDLYMDIDDWIPPSDVFGPLNQQGVTFGSCSTEMYESLLQFEDKHFGAYPGWAEKYHALDKSNDIVDSILAFSEGSIVGAALIFSPVGNNQISQDIPWPKVIGERTGGLACVGMGPDYRGRGAGLGLVCAALLELKHRGLRGCFVDWSTDRALYEGLGFQVWGKYRSSAWRKI